MIELERHIEILLLDHDCVIVPGLGGFMAHHVAARYEAGEGLFLPPLRTLGFNPQLQLNDHLLVQSYIEAYDISYPEALQRIESEVAELQQHLDTEGKYELNDIGTLSLNSEGKIEFEPCEAGILTPELYGLSSFEMLCLDGQTALAALPAGRSDDAAAVLTDIDTETAAPAKAGDAIVVRLSWIRNSIVAAAAILAFFLISQPVANDQIVPEIAQSSMLPMGMANIMHDKEAPTAAEEPAATAPQQEQAQTPEPAVVTPAYTIVLASQTTKRNAESFVSRLQKNGLTQARIAQMSTSRFVRVVYGSFESESEAQSQLRKLRATEKSFAEGWVMKVSQ